MSQTEFLKMRR